ncbi:MULTISPECIES: hypothetical protein [Subtercola]|uniref:Uncharacterized protein n=1 Tax=Subtercola vilae TaxID=2056433 RepID=A0A4T2C061_9MICO|nr:MULTISPECIES: hypothetical protein [Subtercola]MEA9985150.1 hypothetical protein [Subtercola sp. RTI3]TIH37653.1 hypothetical protein D4765_07635 [Subtercola vilae]
MNEARYQLRQSPEFTFKLVRIDTTRNWAAESHQRFDRPVRPVHYDTRSARFGFVIGVQVESSKHAGMRAKKKNSSSFADVAQW